jgi:hypothetical protein
MRALRIRSIPRDAGNLTPHSSIPVDTSLAQCFS